MRYLLSHLISIFKAENRKALESGISTFRTRDRCKAKIKAKGALFINLNIGAIFSV